MPTIHVEFTPEQADQRVARMVKASGKLTHDMAVATVLAMILRDSKGFNRFRDEMKAAAEHARVNWNTVSAAITQGSKIARVHANTLSNTIALANDRTYDALHKVLSARIFGEAGLYPKGFVEARTALSTSKIKSEDERVEERTKSIIEALGGRVGFDADQLARISAALDAAVQHSAEIETARAAARVTQHDAERGAIEAARKEADTSEADAKAA